MPLSVQEKCSPCEKPEAGDVILLGGKTGRDGVGGATGSSRVQTVESVGTAGTGSKGNAIET